MEEDLKELQLLPQAKQPKASSSSRTPGWPSESPVRFRPTGSGTLYEGPSLDLQLSISLRPIRSAPADCDVLMKNLGNYTESNPESGGVESLKWQAAEQIRLAAIEKEYAERVRELTRREMELAQSEFARARHMWERAREEVEKAERLKERATSRAEATTSSCMEITCQSCRQKFRP